MKRGPAEISRVLSDAQRKALVSLPRKRDFVPAHTGFQWPTLTKLKAARLINGVADGLAGLGPKAQHRITPLGFRVIVQIEGRA